MIWLQLLGWYVLLVQFGVTEKVTGGDTDTFTWMTIIWSWLSVHNITLHNININLVNNTHTTVIRMTQIE